MLGRLVLAIAFAATPYMADIMTMSLADPSWSHANYGTMNADTGEVVVEVAKGATVQIGIRSITTGVQVGMTVTQNGGEVATFSNFSGSPEKWDKHPEGQYVWVAYRNTTNEVVKLQVSGKRRPLWGKNEAPPPYSTCKVKKGADSRGPSFGWEAADEDGPNKDYDDLELLVLPG